MRQKTVSNKINVLIISPIPTHLPYEGNRFCILSYSQLLISIGCNVDFLWISDNDYSVMDESHTIGFWKKNLFRFKKKKIQWFNDKFYRSVKFRVTGYFGIDDLFPFGLVGYLRRLQKKNRYNCVIVNYIFLTKCFNAFSDDVHKILYTHDVFTDRYQISGNDWFSTPVTQEAKALRRADTIWAIQENEASFYRYLVRQQIIITTYTYFQIKNTPYKGNRVLLYLAGRNPLNVEAITYFITNMFDDIEKRNSGLQLIIGGPICKEIEHFKSGKIKLYGEITDLFEFYSLGDIFINPTFKGTGLKIKTFEAMAYGKVVICHPHSTEGIYRSESAPILIAESQEEYEKAVDFLFSNDFTVREYKEKTISYMHSFMGTVESRVKQSLGIIDGGK